GQPGAGSAAVRPSQADLCESGRSDLYAVRSSRKDTAMIRRICWPITITVSALAAGIVMLTSTGTPLRPILAFWFLLICPGMAFIRLLHIQEPVVEWTLAIALSIALNTIVAEAMVYAGIWSPPLGLGVMIGLSLLGALFQIVRSYQRAKLCGF